MQKIPLIYKPFIFIFLFYSCLLIFPQPSFAATYYVDGASLGGTCNDANNGIALATPWCTIQKSATTATAGDTVNIRGGTYRETVTASASGTVNNHITFQKYQNETPIINGADILSTWTSLGAEETGGLFATGFETNTFDDFTSTTADSGNSVSTQTSVVNNGTYAMIASFGGTNKNARANKTLTASNDVYARMYFRLNTSFSLAATSSRFDILLLRTSTTTTRAKVSLIQDGSGNLSLQGRIESPTATTFYSGSAGEIQKDTWYYVELRYKGGDSSTGGAELWLDGTSKGSNYTQNTAAYKSHVSKLAGTRVVQHNQVVDHPSTLMI